jgi:hypothetical protein
VDRIESISITWPGGAKQKVDGAAVDKTIVIGQ